MLMLRALRRPAIFRLWLGQALSSIGDEIYRVGLTWLAVGLIGANTGYLNAAQSAALMILSFVGGKWADHWDPLKTMYRIDLIRGSIVLIPVAVSLFMKVPFSLLVVVTILLSGLGAFFDPALQTLLPQFCESTQILRASTGLMATTIRLARMVGPAIVGFLAGIIPPIHFFSLDALSFLFSAGSVRSLGASAPHPIAAQKRSTFLEAIMSGFHALQKNKEMGFVVFSKAITGGTWNLAYGLCIALRVQELTPNDTKSFGLVIAFYGVGNFLGALYFGNLERKRPALMMFIGYIWLGTGFMLIAKCDTIFSLLLAAAYTGFSGTMNEVTFSDLVQTHFPIAEISRIFRLRVASDTAFTLFLMLISPLLFKFLSVPSVFIICGAVWILTGIIGILKFNNTLDVISN